MKEDWEEAGAFGSTDVADWESVATVGDNYPGWIALDVTDSVRDFLTTPALNHGWKISQDVVRGVDYMALYYARGIYEYRSSEAPEIALRPMLILVPESLGATSDNDAAKYADLEGNERNLDDCATNLYRLYNALNPHKSENNGRMPARLTDLWPDYASTGSRVCLADRGVSTGGGRCSYVLAEATGNSDSWAVCCRHHGARILQIDLEGNLFLTGKGGESSMREPCRSPEVRSLGDCKPGSREEFLALRRRFDLAEGRFGRWEKLPELARRLA